VAIVIVLFAALLPGERLRPHHVAGALLGLAGTVLLFIDRGGTTFALAYLPGFAAAIGAAIAWATYSVLSRLFAAVPTAAVAGFCLATAALSGVCHLLFEDTRWPVGAVQWLAVVALGIGPVGAAFYAWDIGVKHGDIRVLGAASYAAPLLSTGYLVLAGYATASLALLGAALLVSARWPSGSQGHVRVGAPFLIRRPILGSKLKAGELETRRDRAAAERPLAKACGGLPGAGANDRLRPFACREIRPERDALDWRPFLLGDLEQQRRARIVVPDLGCIDPMPVRALVARQQKIDRRRRRAAARYGAVVTKRFAKMPALRMRLECKQVDHVSGGKGRHGSCPRVGAEDR
jgi:hypothetical protein